MLRALQDGRGGWEIPVVFAGYFTQEEIRQSQPFDPAEARRLVTEAGYPNGADLEQVYDQDATNEFVSFLQLIQAQLKRGGINVTLQPQDLASLSANVKKGNYTIRINEGGSTGSYRYDPDIRLQTFYPGSPTNYWGIDDPRLTSVIEGQRREVDPAKRRELVRQAGRIVAENYYMPGLFTALEYSFWQPHVRNVNRNGNAPRLPFADLWLDK